MQRAMKKKPTFTHIALGIVCVAFLLPLVSYGVMGLFMRYSGDDYCYGASLTQYGFGQAQIYSYMHKMPYHGNRFSLTFFSLLSDLFGPYANALLPSLFILLWLMGWFILIRQLFMAQNLRIRWLEDTALSACVVFFTLYLAPTLPQNLYWRSGMLPYLAPLVFTTFLVAWVFNRAHLECAKPGSLGLTGCIAFVASGFSETASALFVGFWCVIALVNGFLQLAKKRWARPAFTLSLAALVGTVAGVVLMAVSPAIQSSMAERPSIGLLTIGLRSIKYASSFITGSLGSFPVPFMVASTFIFFMSAWVFSRQPIPKLPHTAWIGLIILFNVTGVLLIACCMIPSIYTRSAYPDPRALLPARSVVIVVLLGTAAILGMLFGAWLSSKRSYPTFVYSVILGMAVVLSLYCVRATPKIYTNLHLYRKWSAFWDARDRDIRSAKNNGRMEIEVLTLDHIIPDVGELASDPTYWYNGCAAGYYGVTSITADMPGWDK